MSLTVRELLRMMDELRDDLSALRAERDALVERANEQYLEQAAEIAALQEKNAKLIDEKALHCLQIQNLREAIGLLTTLPLEVGAKRVEFGSDPYATAQAIFDIVQAEIAALREGAIKKAQEIQDLRVEIGELDLVLQSEARNADRVIKGQAAEITALREAVRVLVSNFEGSKLEDGTVAWNLGSLIFTADELPKAAAVFSSIQRAMEEER